MAEVLGFLQSGFKRGRERESVLYESDERDAQIRETKCAYE